MSSLQKVKRILDYGTENRESFMARVATMYGTLHPDYIDIERAYNAAKEAFRDVVRDEGNRYFEHLRAATLIAMDFLRIRDPHIIKAILLHDILEDRDDWTPQRLVTEFGYQTAFLVESVTKPKRTGEMTKAELNTIYKRKLAVSGRDALIVKLPDNLHNTMTLSARPKEKIQPKINETRGIYIPFAEQHIILIHELEEAADEAQAYYNGLTA